MNEHKKTKRNEAKQRQTREHQIVIRGGQGTFGDAPWERQEGHVGDRHRSFMNLGLISGPHFGGSISGVQWASNGGQLEIIRKNKKNKGT